MKQKLLTIFILILSTTYTIAWAETEWVGDSFIIIQTEHDDAPIYYRASRQDSGFTHIDNAQLGELTQPTLTLGGELQVYPNTEEPAPATMYYKIDNTDGFTAIPLPEIDQEGNNAKHKATTQVNIGHLAEGKHTVQVYFQSGNKYDSNYSQNYSFTFSILKNFKPFTIGVNISTAFIGSIANNHIYYYAWNGDSHEWITPTRASVGGTWYYYTFYHCIEGLVVVCNSTPTFDSVPNIKQSNDIIPNNKSGRYVLTSKVDEPKKIAIYLDSPNTSRLMGKWDKDDTWTFGIPYSGEDVTIAHNVTASTPIQVGNITFNPSGILTLTPDATLHAQTVTCTDQNKLKLTDGATLTFTGTAPHATIEMNSDATHIANGSTSWNYIAIPTKGVMPNSFFSGAWMLEWDESIGTDGKEGAAGGAWEFINPDKALGQHKGYAITQEAAKTYTFQGQLVNPHSIITLGYTDGAVCPGFNFVGNSWTSPIEIAAFKASDFTHTDATIYLFDENNAENPTAYPIGTAGNKLIAPLQGYFLRATSIGASVSYTYDRLTGRSTFIAAQPTALQRTAPASHYETLTLRVQGEQYYDCTTLHYGAQFTDQFDQGYEALKFMGGVTAPQLYSIKGTDQMAHVAENHFTETTIGFRRGVDSIYTITFEQVPCDQDLYLQDLITGTKTRITHDASYTFQSDTSYNDIQRFRISTQQLPTSFPPIQTNTYLQGRTLYIENYQACNLQAYIIDITGRIVQQHSLNSKGAHHVSLAHLSAGTYLVRLTSDTHETTHKIILE